MENNHDQYRNRRIRTALPNNNLTTYSKVNFTARVSNAVHNYSDSMDETSRRTADHDTNFSSIYYPNRNIPKLEEYELPLPSYQQREAHSENPPYQRFSENSSGLTDNHPRYHPEVAVYCSSYKQANTDPFVSYTTERPYRSYNCMGSRETDDTQQFGLIILGNAGVGKSFLGNILLSREVFVHEFSVGSVTHTTEYSEIQIGDFKLAIFNIPGLIEANQKRIDLNKREIEKAFLARPNSIVLYVFGNQRGRLRDEDVVAFNAINAAYSFQSESLVLVMNDLDKNRPSNYEGTTLVLLQQLLPYVHINEQNVCFLDRIDRDNPNQRQFLKEQLLAVTVRFIPTIHRKKQDIQTTYDQLEAEKRRIQKQQRKFDDERSKFMKDIQKSQALLNETIDKHQTEAQSYRKAIERQEQMLLQQQKEFEKERRQYTSQLNALRVTFDRTKKEYEQLCGNDSVSKKTLQAYEQDLKELRKEYEELSKRISTQNSKKSGCVIS